MTDIDHHESIDQLIATIQQDIGACHLVEAENRLAIVQKEMRSGHIPQGGDAQVHQLQDTLTERRPLCLTEVKNALRLLLQKPVESADTQGEVSWNIQAQVLLERWRGVVVNATETADYQQFRDDVAQYEKKLNDYQIHLSFRRQVESRWERANDPDARLGPERVNELYREARTIARGADDEYPENEYVRLLLTEAEERYQLRESEYDNMTSATQIGEFRGALENFSKYREGESVSTYDYDGRTYLGMKPLEEARQLVEQYVRRYVRDQLIRQTEQINTRLEDNNPALAQTELKALDKYSNLQELMRGPYMDNETSQRYHTLQSRIQALRRPLQEAEQNAASALETISDDVDLVKLMVAWRQVVRAEHSTHAVKHSLKIAQARGTLNERMIRFVDKQMEAVARFQDSLQLDEAETLCQDMIEAVGEMVDPPDFTYEIEWQQQYRGQLQSQLETLNVSKAALDKLIQARNDIQEKLQTAKRSVRLHPDQANSVLANLERQYNHGRLRQILEKNSLYNEVRSDVSTRLNANQHVLDLMKLLDSNDISMVQEGIAIAKEQAESHATHRTEYSTAVAQLMAHELYLEALAAFIFGELSKARSLLDALKKKININNSIIEKANALQQKINEEGKAIEQIDDIYQQAETAYSDGDLDTLALLYDRAHNLKTPEDQEQRQKLESAKDNIQEGYAELLTEHIRSLPLQDYLTINADVVISRLRELDAARAQQVEDRLLALGNLRQANEQDQRGEFGEAHDILQRVLSMPGLYSQEEYDLVVDWRREAEKNHLDATYNRLVTRISRLQQQSEADTTLPTDVDAFVDDTNTYISDLPTTQPDEAALWVNHLIGMQLDYAEHSTQPYVIRAMMQSAGQTAARWYGIIEQASEASQSTNKELTNRLTTRSKASAAMLRLVDDLKGPPLNDLGEFIEIVTNWNTAQKDATAVWQEWTQNHLNGIHKQLQQLFEEAVQDPQATEQALLYAAKMYVLNPARPYPGVKSQIDRVMQQTATLEGDHERFVSRVKQGILNTPLELPNKEQGSLAEYVNQYLTAQISEIHNRTISLTTQKSILSFLADHNETAEQSEGEARLAMTAFNPEPYIRHLKNIESDVSQFRSAISTFAVELDQYMPTEQDVKNRKSQIGASWDKFTQTLAGLRGAEEESHISFEGHRVYKDIAESKTYYQEAYDTLAETLGELRTFAEEEKFEKALEQHAAISPDMQTIKQFATNHQTMFSLYDTYFVSSRALDYLGWESSGKWLKIKANELEVLSAWQENLKGRVVSVEEQRHEIDQLSLHCDFDRALNQLEHLMVLTSQQKEQGFLSIDDALNELQRPPLAVDTVREGLSPTEPKLTGDDSNPGTRSANFTKSRQQAGSAAGQAILLEMETWAKELDRSRGEIEARHDKINQRKVSYLQMVQEFNRELNDARYQMNKGNRRKFTRARKNAEQALLSLTGEFGGCEGSIQTLQKNLDDLVDRGNRR